MDWHSLALGYFAYLIAMAFVRPDAAPARTRIVIGGLAAAAVVTLDWRFSPLGRAGSIIVPAAVLLAGYRLSGLFFTRIDFPAEARLLASDRRLLVRPGILDWHARMPSAIKELLELSYLLVYPALPIGAVVLLLSNHSSEVGHYWTVVTTAGWLCFGTLPWLRTRPPMLLEPQPNRGSAGPIRRLNQAIAARASVHACTIPSGHAACGLAAGIVVSNVLPAIGAVFIVHAIALAVASVLGRYHYAVDSALGISVAVLVAALA